MDEDEDQCEKDVPLVEKVNIQDLIRDRKVERRLKAEEKRHADLQRITDMRSTSGIDPLQRFPKEIWMKLLDEFDPEDRGKLWGLHRVFRDLMEASRVRNILFPQILKVDAFQHCLGKNPARRLRLISKISRNTFDCCMEDELVIRVREMEATSSSSLDHTTNLSLNVESERILATLLSNFKEGENPAKRFFSRALSVSFSGRGLKFVDEDEVEIDDPERSLRIAEFRCRFQNRLTALLKVIGGQIWHFRIFLHELETVPFSFSQVYILFQRWISLMPNLKWLEVCIDDSERTIKAEKDIVRKRRILSRKYPFPHLESLERLSLHFRVNLGQREIIQALITTNRHLKILDFTDAHDAVFDVLPTYVIKSLNLTSIFVTSEFWYGGHFTDIQSIINFNWQLKSVTLDLDMRRCKLDSVFRFLEKFPTLEQVDLRKLNGCRFGDDHLYGYLELHNLINFSLTLQYPSVDYSSDNIDLLFSLQFLLHCKNLKSIYWSMCGVDDTELRNHLKRNESPGGTMDFRAGLRYMYESSIWDVFPFLDTVTVDVKNLMRRRLENNSCLHTYHRKVRGVKAPVSQFLESHSCSCNRELENCVVLLQ